MSIRTPIAEHRWPTSGVEPRGGAQVDRDVVDVDVLDAELGRERACDVLREEPAALDEHLAEAPAGAGLLAECFVELLGGEELALQQHRTEVGTCVVTREGVIEAGKIGERAHCRRSPSVVAENRRDLDVLRLIIGPFQVKLIPLWGRMGRARLAVGSG